MSAGFTGPVDVTLRAHVEGLLTTAGPGGALPIVQAGEPVLRQRAATYTGQLGDLLVPFVEAMRRTMYAAPGVGLAAPQVGVGLALAVVEDRGSEQDPRERTPLPFRVLVNPDYAPADEPDGGAAQRVSFFEGCLSIDGWHALVPRLRRVRLTGQDETGAPIDETLVGWPARIIQHETDHLRGELYIDHAVPRSFASNANLVRLWGGAADPAPVAEALGFEIP
ncbi:peptide deformylase [Xylanimonas ulmi]|uniref:Peptide deformylase n=1 Tax=Xylanimonas ulmi TaxID=228973 RepID=A0A4Q7M8Y6_9MICO|nr:peptide deformylase [Xylanibacterium ulmi]RZS63178.1 peptide deformylase [Xylanibacterium ulmi]